MWRERRRPEIVKLYETEIYGRIPDNAPKVKWEVTETDAAARDGAAIMQRVVGRMGDKPDGPRMNLTVYLPAKASGPVPMLLSLAFAFPPGGRGAADKSKGSTPGQPSSGTQQTKTPPTPRGPAFDATGELIGRGWGYATLGYSDIQPDRADQWTSGVIGLTLKEGQTQPAPDEWGTISAWSWGISRAIDYLESVGMGQLSSLSFRKKISVGLEWFSPPDKYWPHRIQPYAAPIWKRSESYRWLRTANLYPHLEQSGWQGSTYFAGQ